MANDFEYRLHSVLRFGKHKGQTIQWVIDNDLSWLKWAYKKGLSDPEFNFKLHLHAREEFFEKDNLAQGKEPSGYKKIKSKRRF
jgi:hypothetical protein